MKPIKAAQDACRRMGGRGALRRVGSRISSLTPSAPPVVRDEHDDRVVVDTLLVDLVQHEAHVVVRQRDGALVPEADGGPEPLGECVLNWAGHAVVVQLAAVGQGQEHLAVHLLRLGDAGSALGGVAVGGSRDDPRCVGLQTGVGHVLAHGPQRHPVAQVREVEAQRGEVVAPLLEAVPQVIDGSHRHVVVAAGREEAGNNKEA